MTSAKEIAKNASTGFDKQNSKGNNNNNNNIQPNNNNNNNKKSSGSKRNSGFNNYNGSNAKISGYVPAYKKVILQLLLLLLLLLKRFKRVKWQSLLLLMDSNSLGIRISLCYPWK